MRPLRLCGVVYAFSFAIGAPTAFAAPDEPADVPKSVILLIGDGMGPQQVGLLMDWADAAGKAPTNFERLANEGVVGYLRTAPANGPITDSAAGATALACGCSTKNGEIAMDPAGKPVPTCLEDAKARGRRTGLVTTTTITHATPACFAAHVTSRGAESDIAKQYVTGPADVLFGGGLRFFPEDVRAGASAAGFKWVATREELLALPADADKALGVFAAGQMPYLIDRDQEGEAKAPSLPEMARKALELVSRGDKGFFLMIEGGRIDHACHAKDAPGALGELREFDETIGLALAWRAEHPDTLVVVTADHETGGLAVTSGGAPDKRLTAADFLAMAKVEKSIEGLGIGGPAPKDFDASKFGVGHADFYSPGWWVADAAGLERSARFRVTFSTSGHTTTPVPIAAVGPGASAFAGVHRNTQVGMKLREWMGR